jgi:hypothetical protein
MMLKITLWICALFFAVPSFAATAPAGSYSGQTGTAVQTWVAPDGLNKVTKHLWDSIAYGRNADGNSVDITRSKNVALLDGRMAGNVAKGAVNGAIAFNLAKGFFGGGAGLAFAAISIIPAFVDWMNQDNGQNIRLDPTHGVQKKDGSVCTVAPCPTQYRYATYNTANWGPWMTDRSAACYAAPLSPAPWVRNYMPSATICRDINGSQDRSIPGQIQTPAAQPSGSEWLPASMDDIAPYMDTPVPLDLLPQLIDKGVEVPVVPGTLDTVLPPEKPAGQRVTDYPAPPPIIIIEIDSGNKYGLPSNTPTNVGTSTGSVSVRPGASTTSGTPVNFPAPTPVNAPTQTNKSATYDPVADKTTTTSTTTTDTMQKTETASGSSSVSNTPSKSEVKTGTTTVTNVTNVTNNTTTTTTNVAAGEPAKTDCQIAPDSLGCVKVGEPPAAEVLPKSTVSVTLTPSVFASSMSCPGDTTVPINIGPFHSSAVFSYSPLCNAATTYVAPLILLLGAAVAAFVFVGGLKT